MYGTLLQKLESFGEVISRKLFRAILSGQNDDMLYEVGLLCLRVQETFELKAL